MPRSHQESPETLLYRAQQHQQIIMRTGYKCAICGRFSNTQHEIVFRSSTLNNEEARCLSFQKELCVLLCPTCHDTAHTPEMSLKLLLHNCKLYGRDEVEAALQALQFVLKGRLGIGLPEEVDG